MPTDREIDCVCGFAFVEMETEAEEAAAIAALDLADWMERVMKVNNAKPCENRVLDGGCRNN